MRYWWYLIKFLKVMYSYLVNFKFLIGQWLYFIPSMNNLDICAELNQSKSNRSKSLGASQISEVCIHFVRSLALPV